LFLIFIFLSDHMEVSKMYWWIA